MKLLMNKRWGYHYRRTATVLGMIAVFSVNIVSGETSYAKKNEEKKNSTAYEVKISPIVSHNLEVGFVDILASAKEKAEEEQEKVEHEKIVNIIEAQPKQKELQTIECTAYEPTGNRCADGTWPVEGETLAGKREWLGRRCKLYHTDGTYIGEFTFHDTGFGHDPDGDGIGSIQDGSRIDYYMDSVDACNQWGVRDVLIEFLD